jgi:hypothetical protein
MCDFSPINSRRMQTTHDLLLKAAEIRQVASSVAAPSLRKELLMIASHYERLAGLPRERLSRDPAPRHQPVPGANADDQAALPNSDD